MVISSLCQQLLLLHWVNFSLSHLVFSLPKYILLLTWIWGSFFFLIFYLQLCAVAHENYLNSLCKSNNCQNFSRQTFPHLPCLVYTKFWSKELIQIIFISQEKCGLYSYPPLLKLKLKRHHKKMKTLVLVHVSILLDIQTTLQMFLMTQNTLDT